MTNNDILRKLRYTFDFDDDKMISIFAHAEREVLRSELCNWLKDEEHEEYENCSDVQLANFLNGFITERRGKKDGPLPKPEIRLNNNLILIKLKIALNLKTEDIIAILKLADFNLSAHELSAFTRKSDHKHFRECKDQILRNFLKGVRLKYRKN